MINPKRVCVENKELKILFESAFGDRSLKQIAIDTGINYSTLKKYKSGDLLMPENVFNLIHDKSGKVDLPSLIYYSSNWGAIKGGKKGIKSLMSKYSVETIRKWRVKGGYNSPSIILNTKRIIHPERSELLGEFIGIVLGDGTLTKYFVRLSGNRITDLPYFHDYIPNLVQTLFGLQSSITYDDNLIYVTICSKELATYLHEEWNLPFGDKINNKAKLHESIINDTLLSKGCIRGLVDTDGIIGRDGKALCLRFTSHNPLVLRQMSNLLMSFGLLSFSYETEIGTRKLDKIKKYFEIIGSSNPKHIIRFLLKINNNKLLYASDTPNYFYMFNNIDLPYKLRISGLAV